MPCVGMAFRPRYMWYHVWLMISAQRDTLTDSTTHRHFMLTARLPWEFEHQGEHFNVNETGPVVGRCGGLRQEWRSFSEMRALWHFAACPRYLGRSWWIASVSLNSVRKAVVVQSNVFYSSRNKYSRTYLHRHIEHATQLAKQIKQNQVLYLRIMSSSFLYSMWLMRLDEVRKQLVWSTEKTFFNGTCTC